MKQKLLLSLLMVVLTGATLAAHDFEVDGIYYDIVGDNAVVTYRASNINPHTNNYSGDIVIPDSVTNEGVTYCVTAIGEKAFYGSKVTSVLIPPTVTSIGDYAFLGCYKLTDMVIPDMVSSIGDGAFDSCSGLVSVKLSSALSSIGDKAFYRCRSLLNIEIPDAVTSIGVSAFEDCSTLTSVSLGNSLQTIGDRAFFDCIALNSVEMGFCSPACGEDAFNGCTTLTGVNIADIGAWCGITFSGMYANPCFYAHHLYMDGQEILDLVVPDSVTSIGAFAFYYCTSLTSITIPASVMSIGDRAFYGCAAVTAMVVANDNPCYNSRDNCNAVIETSTGKLIAGCMNTVIPATVPSIGEFAFCRCTSLVSIDIPGSVLSIGNDAFKYCSGLKIVTGGDAVTSIGDKAFFSCQRLVNFRMPASVTTIGDQAFSGCYSLKSVSIPDAVTTIGQYAFSTCESLESVYIGSSVSSIGEGAFKVCNSITKVEISDLENWCNIAFGNATANPLSLRYSYLYMNGQLIRDLVIPATVTSVRTYAFNNASFRSVTIPASVTSIGGRAFYSCSAHIYCYISDPSMVTVSTNSFSLGVDPYSTLHVPVGSLDAYMASSDWQPYFGSIVEMENAGDINNDGRINISDVTVLINMLLSGGEVPAWCDMNGDGKVSISDVTALIDLLLRAD